MFWTTSDGLKSLKAIMGLPVGVSQIACGDIGYMCLCFLLLHHSQSLAAVTNW